MTLQIFGHKSPDTDSTGSPIVWSWYLNEVKGIAAAPKLLGEPNTEAAFVLKRWNLDKPEIIDGVDVGAPVARARHAPCEEPYSRLTVIV